MATKTAAAAIALVLIILAITTARPSTATVYTVGDEAGWTASGNCDGGVYWGWAWTKKFYVGDVLLFKYDNRSDSVVQVNLGDKLLCNTSNPIATYNTGSDAVTLDAPGQYFFISGVSAHCRDADQMLQVFVNPTPPTTPEAPTMSVSNPAPTATPAPPSVSNPRRLRNVYVFAALFIIWYIVTNNTKKNHGWSKV